MYHRPHVLYRPVKYGSATIRQRCPYLLSFLGHLLAPRLDLKLIPRLQEDIAAVGEE